MQDVSSSAAGFAQLLESAAEACKLATDYTPPTAEVLAAEDCTELTPLKTRHFYIPI